MTQHERIRKYIDDFGSISPMEAFADLGITKLSTRIGEMIRDGYRCEKVWVCSTNRYGQKVSYLRYKRAV